MMKRMLITAGLAVLLAAGTALPGRADETTTRLVKLNGTVQIQQGGQGDWATLLSARLMSPGDAGQTGDDSNAKIAVVDNDQYLRLFPDTTVTFLGVTQQGGKTVYQTVLTKGSMVAEMRPMQGNPRRMEIKTPAATLSIRGCSLYIQLGGAAGGGVIAKALVDSGYVQFPDGTLYMISPGAAINITGGVVTPVPADSVGPPAGFTPTFAGEENQGGPPANPTGSSSASVPTSPGSFLPPPGVHPMPASESHP